MVMTDLFLTHDWGFDENGRNNHDRVTTVNEELKKMGFKTWFDSDRMQGDIVQQMSSGIENTQVAVVFLTQKYLEKVNGEDPSDNCKLEFMHSARVKTTARMLCVVMENRMKNTADWTGAIGMYLAGKIYIDMSGDLEDAEYLKSQLELLQKEIEGMGIAPSGDSQVDVVVEVDQLALESPAPANSSVSPPFDASSKSTSSPTESSDASSPAQSSAAGSPSQNKAIVSSKSPFQGKSFESGFKSDDGWAMESPFATTASSYTSSSSSYSKSSTGDGTTTFSSHSQSSTSDKSNSGASPFGELSKGTDRNFSLRHIHDDFDDFFSK